MSEILSKEERKTEKTRVSRLNTAARKSGRTIRIIVKDADDIPLSKELSELAEVLGLKQIENSKRFWLAAIESMKSHKLWSEAKISHLETLFSVSYKQLERSKLFTSFCLLYNSRQARCDYTPLEFHALQQRDEKRKNRLGATVRIKDSLPTGVKHRSEISPWLDLSNDLAILVETRLHEYSRHHKCPHGRNWNGFKISGNRYIVPECDHHHECYTGEVKTSPCRNCGFRRMLVLERVCGHAVLQCSRCMFSYYADTFNFETATWSEIRCLCDVDKIRMQKCEEFKHDFYSTGSYVAKSSTDLMAEFLARNRRSRTSKWKTSIKDCLTGSTTKNWAPTPSILPTVLDDEEFPELQRVVPHGGVQSLATNAKAVASTMMSEMATKFKNFGESILQWIKQAVTKDFYKENPLFVEVLTAVGLLCDAFATFVGRRTAFDYLLIIAGLSGTAKSSCATLALLMVEVLATAVSLSESKLSAHVSYLVTPVHTILQSLKNSAEEADRLEFLKHFQSLRRFFIHRKLKTVPKTIQALVAMNIDDVPDPIKQAYSSATFFFADKITSSDIAELIRMLNEYENEVEHFTAADFDNQAVRVEQHGFMDMLSMLVTCLPLAYHKGMFKTVSLFCKDILPMIMVSKNVVGFATSIWRWLLKIMGFMSVDTKSWLQLELRDKESPIYACVVSCYNYKMAAETDSLDASNLLSIAREELRKAEEYIRTEERYDPCTMGFLRDSERIISSVGLPPVARKYEPFCVRLYGAPGTGKSRSVPVLFGPILGTSSNKEFYSKTFCRNMQEYWDGVGTRQCILYDDFGQYRAEPIDLLEMILLVSAAPMMANMANITGSTPKGISIDPKLVVACANLQTDNSNQISDNEAIARRFHLVFHVTCVNGESRFTLSGGSMLGYTARNNQPGKQLVPAVKDLTLAEAQMFVYHSYMIFVNDREAGLKNIDSQIKTNLPPLLSYNKDGIASTKPEMYDPAKTTEFFKTLNVKEYTVPRKSCFDEPPEDVRKFVNDAVRVENHATVSWEMLLDAFVAEASANYLVFCFGVTLMSSFTFMMDFSTKRSWIDKLKALLIPAATSLAGVLIMFLAYKYNTRDVEDVEQHSSVAKGKSTAQRVTPHAGKSVVDVQNILERATCKIQSNNGLTVHGLMIAETYFLTVEHIFVPSSGNRQYVEDGTEYRLVIPNIADPVLFRFEREKMRPLTKIVDGKEVSVDMVVYQLPRCIPLQRNILNKFWKADRLLTGQQGLLLQYQRNSRTLVWKETTLQGEQKVIYDQAGKRWVQTLVYGSHSGEPGMCGAPIMLASGDSNSPVVGVHIAGNPAKAENSSMILVLTKDMIIRGCPTLCELNPPEMDTQYTKTIVQVDQHAVLLENTQLQEVAKLKRPVYNPTKTTLTKSLVFEEIVPHTTEPSVLSNYDHRIPDSLRGNIDLYKDGINKMAKTMNLDYEELSSVREDMSEWYDQLRVVHFGKSKKPPYTLGECLNTDVLKGIDLTTSPGYPFVFQGIKRSELFVRTSGGVVLATELFLSQLDDDLDHVLKGCVPPWFFTTALKDERRPIEKVRVRPKTRLFTVCPIVFIILEKMYYSRFMELMTVAPDVPYAGGVDRLGKSWHTMFARLRAKSDRGFGGDYECFDGRISYGLMSSVQNIMEQHVDTSGLFIIDPKDCVTTLLANELCNRINAKNLTHGRVLQAVRHAGLNPTYLMNDFAYRASGTLASGRWVTQLVGTLTGEMLQRAAWNELVPPSGRGGYNFKKYVAHAIMGDDNINAVVESATPYFNAETFSSWLSKRGMTYTSADKKGCAISVEPLENISFLKNKTGLYHGYYAPLMDQCAALEQLNWVRKSPYHSPLEALEMNANSALRAIFFYGRNRYNEIRDQLLELQPKLQLEQFNTLHHQFLDYGGFPGYQPGEASHYQQVGEMPKELEKWIDEHDVLEKVEISGGAGPSQRDEKNQQEENRGLPDEQEMAAEQLKNLSIVQQHGKYWWNECPMCNMKFESQNRYIDHLVAYHQDENTWRHETTVQGMLAKAPVSTLRIWIRDLNDSQARKDKNDFCAETDLLHVKIEKEHIPIKEVIAAINSMINQSKSKNFTATTRESRIVKQNTSLPVDDIIRGVSEKKRSPSSRRVHDVYDLSDNEDLVAAAYTIVKAMEAIPRVVPHSGVDTNALPVTTTVTLTEEPIVTDPSKEKSLKDPTTESRTAQNQQGTILADKGFRDHTMVKTGNVLKFSSPRAESHLNDQSWDLQMMLQKWHLVATIPWQVNSPRETVLFEADVVKDLITTAFAQSPFNVFKDFRCAGVRIKVVMVASKFHQGRAVIGFYPTMVPKAINAYPRSPPTTKTLIEIGANIVDPAQGGESEFYIPFRHVKGWLALEEDDCLGQLYTIVHSPLNVSDSGSQEVQIRLFFCLDNPEFKIPRANVVSAKHARALERKILENERPVEQLSPLRYGGVSRVVPHAGVEGKLAQDKGQVGLNQWSREGQYIAPTRARTGDARTSHFGEKEDNLLNFCKRYRKVYSGGTSFTSNSARVSIPVQSFLQSFWPIWFFNTMRGALNLKIQYTANRGGAGANASPTTYLTCMYEPQRGASDAQYFNALSAYGNSTGRMIMINNGAFGEIQVPLVHRAATMLNPSFYEANFQSTSPYFVDGSLFIEMYSNSTGATLNWNIDIFASVSDEFGVGVFRGVPQFFINENFPFANLSIRNAEEEKENEAVRVVQHGLFGELGQTLDSGIEGIMKEVIPEKVVSTALSVLDKPTVCTPPTFVTNKVSGFMNFAVQPEPIDKFTLHPAAQIVCDEEHFGTKTSEATMDSMFSRPSFLATTRWSIDQRPGDVLFDIPVGPTLDFLLDRPEVFSPTIMCAISKNFKYYRGGITFVFDVVGTMYHEGKLDLTFHPNIAAAPSDYDVRMSQYVHSVTVRNTENRFIVTVPYLSEEPFKRVHFDQPWNPPSATASPPASSQFFLGNLSMSVGAPLRVPETVPKEVEIMVYVMPATDFELYWPTMDGFGMTERSEV